jgi:SAM-dependent methyltransferase
MTEDELAALLPRLRGLVREEIERTAQFVSPEGTPRISRMAELLRDVPLLRWNSKVLGSYVAAALYEQRVAPGARTPPAAPPASRLSSHLCRAADFVEPWMHHWAHALRIMPLYHRKTWEDCYVPQSLHAAGVLREGARGLGFAVGIERLPSLFAARGLRVTATDLDPQDSRSAGWLKTSQNAQAKRSLHYPEIVDADRFETAVDFAFADMTRIGPELEEGYDFCWSVCALEHLGSIQAGLDFIVNATRCVRPGGYCVHTTEYNLDQAAPTFDHWGTVLFQRQHIEALAGRLAEAGHELVGLNLTPGNDILDGFVDVPPFIHHPRSDAAYPRAPHLVVSVDGKPATSLGLVVRVGG